MDSYVTTDVFNTFQIRYSRNNSFYSLQDYTLLLILHHSCFYATSCHTFNTVVNSCWRTHIRDTKDHTYTRLLLWLRLYYHVKRKHKEVKEVIGCILPSVYNWVYISQSRKDNRSRIIRCRCTYLCRRSMCPVRILLSRGSNRDRSFSPKRRI